MNTETLSTDLLRRLALMQHLGEDYFIIDGIAYEGNKADFDVEWDLSEEHETISFFDYVIANCIEIGELEVNDCDDYLVLTDEEADEKWEESLDSYIEECILPELPDNLRFYFDDEKWKRDAKYDGRGHSLSTYDGHENEETVEGETFYIYRIN